MNKSNAIAETPAASEPASGGSHRVLVQFVSLALLTQVVLLLNQVVLLPIQLRIWGTNLSAYWYSIVAIASITGASDFGLRSAGHADLMRHANDPNDVEAKTQFQHIWAWIRILVASITALLIAADFIYCVGYRGLDYPVWRLALVLGIALEGLLCIRVTFLDSRGLYREAEAGYLVLAAARLILAVGALLIFHASPAVLAWIWLFTGLLGIIQQGKLCSRLGLMLLFEPIPAGLSFRTLAIARHTMADPCSGWARINGPVVVLSIIAQPIAIVTYVALRAVFGAARTTIQQLSRYASVEYICLRQASKFELAEIHITMCTLLAAFFASGVTAAVVADNGRLASLLLNKLDVPIYREIAITFGLASTFYCYQITQGVCRRFGEVEQVARRQYFYILCTGVFAIIALVVKSTLLWLILMMIADILVSLSFMLKTPKGGILSQTSAGWRAFVSSAASSALIFMMWLVVHFETFDFLNGRALSDFVWTAVFYLPWILLIGAIDFSLLYGRPARLNAWINSTIVWWRSLRATKLQNE